MKMAGLPLFSKSNICSFLRLAASFIQPGRVKDVEDFFTLGHCIKGPFTASRRCDKTVVRLIR